MTSPFFDEESFKTKNPTDEEPDDDVMKFLFPDEEDEDGKSDVELRGTF